MGKLLSIYFVLFSVLLYEAGGFDAFYFPEYLEKKVSNQIKKTYSLKDFKVLPCEFENLVLDADVMEITDLESNKIGYGFVTLANGCKIGGCMNPDEIDPETEHEQFYFMTLYDLEGIIMNIKVLEYTSQYGYEITAKNWLKQFIGKKGGGLSVDKEIDGISGATISVNSIVNDVNSQQEYIEKLMPLTEFR